MRLDLSYPRPRLRRERWQSLDGPWDFACDPRDEGRHAGWARGGWADVEHQTITVPFAPQWPASGVENFDGSEVVWYRRRVTLDGDPGELTALHFGAVDHACEVYLDGALVATHVGGSTPFCLTVPADAGERVLVVRVSDPNRLDQPRGKQHWHGRNDGIFYPPTTGIWQPVWAEPLARTHLDDLVVTADPTAGTLHLDATVAAGAGATVEVTASIEGREVAWAAGRVDRRGRARLVLSLAEQQDVIDANDLIDAGGVRLWTPEKPDLYDLDLRVRQGGVEVDRVASYAGVRSVSIRDGRWCLNGRPYEQRLVLDQGYWPTSGMTAPTPEALARDIELAKELGFNGARKHQKIEDPRWLYAADVLGFLVWDELPSGYAFSPALVAELTRDLTALIARDRSHPCVVAWVPMNESWGTPDLADPRQQALQQSLYHLAHALDGSRPVVGNDGWELAASDVVALHDYREPADIAAGYRDPDAARRQIPAGRRFVIGDGVASDAPWLLTEFGGLAVGGERGWGYHQVGDGEALLARLGELLDAVRSGPWQGYCYTQLTDVGEELNGLLTADRRPKLDAAAFARRQRREPEAG